MNEQNKYQIECALSRTFDDWNAQMLNELLCVAYRELQSMQSRLESLEKTKEALCKALDDSGDCLIDAGAKIESLEKDVARLNWMSENYMCADFQYGEPATEVIIIEFPKKSRYCGDLRVDVDTAMQANKGE